MGPFIITIIVFIILSLWIGFIFFSDIIYLLVNIPLLWIVWTRAYYEIREKKILYPYFASLIITTILFIFFGDYLVIKYILWQVLFVVIVLIIAEIIIILLNLYEKYEVEDKVKKSFQKKK